MPVYSKARKLVVGLLSSIGENKGSPGQAHTPDGPTVYIACTHAWKQLFTENITLRSNQNKELFPRHKIPCHGPTVYM
jgi:hypothetical protein